MAHSLGCKVPKTPSSIQKRKPNSWARMATERMLPATSSSRSTVPTMINSASAPATARYTRNTALERLGIAANNISRTASESSSACQEAFLLPTLGGRSASQGSAGRAIHSHSAKLPRNSNRKSLSGARDNFPKRIRTCSLRTKSDTSQSCCILSSLLLGLRRADHNHMHRQRSAQWYTSAPSASSKSNRDQNVVTRLARRRAEGLLCSASKRGENKTHYSLTRILA